MHTPAPWHVESPEATIVRESNGGSICQLKFLAGPHGLSGRRPDHEVEANARLIAAAPDLLAVVKISPCPRPANAAPDHLTVEQCMGHGECGCDAGAAVRKATAP